MKDPYEILGVAKTASADEIRKAYRKLASLCCTRTSTRVTDKHAEEQFKEVTAANELLSEPEKRRRYDAERDRRFSLLKGLAACAILSRLRGRGRPSV